MVQDYDPTDVNTVHLMVESVCVKIQKTVLFFFFFNFTNSYLTKFYHEIMKYLAEYPNDYETFVIDFI